MERTGLRWAVLRAAAAAAMAALPAAASDLSPGRHKRVPCEGSAEWTYDVYVPGAYARDTDRKLPVLFLSSPGANPGFMAHVGWAESRGVIIVCINDTRNNMGIDNWTKIQDAVIDSVEATLRVHPCLRFSMGCSGGGMASMHLARLHGDEHAGIVMLAHSGNNEDRGLAKHIAVAFVHGEVDDVHPVSASRRVCKSLEARGHPTRIKTGPWGHNASTKENREEMLDWMLDLMRLMHPGLPAAELKAAKAEIERRAKALADIADPGRRLAEAQRLMSLPKRLWQRHSREVYEGWFSASYELASAMPDPVAVHSTLTDMSEDERVRSCSSGDKKKLMGELRKLRRESAVKKEWKARQIYAQIAAIEKRLPPKPPPTRRMQVVNSYLMLARKYPKTACGKKAAEDAKRLAGQ